MKSEVREYDMVWIIKPNLGEPQYQEIITKVQDWISKNEGEIINSSPWGLRDVAITFHKYEQGYFVNTYFKGTRKTIEALKNNIKVTESIIRFLLVKKESVNVKTKASAKRPVRSETRNYRETREPRDTREPREQRGRDF